MDDRMRETRLRGSAHFPFERYAMRTSQQPISVACHWQEDTELLFVHHGQIALQVDQKQFTLSQGDAACINPQQLHSIRGLTLDTAYDAYVFPLPHLLFSQEEQNQLEYLRPLAEGKLGFPTLLPRCSEPCRLVQEILRLDREHPPCHQLHIKATLLQLIAVLAQENALIPMQFSRQSDLCRGILDYIHQHYGEQCSVEQVAHGVGLSPAYFSAFFTKHFAQRFSAYLLSYRLEQSCTLLLQTEKSITEIALVCGFSSSSHFIHRFRQSKGITPLAYRRSKGTASNTGNQHPSV